PVSIIRMAASAIPSGIVGALAGPASPDASGTAGPTTLAKDETTAWARGAPATCVLKTSRPIISIASASDEAVKSGSSFEGSLAAGEGGKAGFLYSIVRHPAAL